MYCQNCGKQIVDGAKFCTNCGTAVNGTTESASVATRPNPFAEYESSGNENPEKKSVLSVIRGIPFLLLFLAFFLPLIVVSCPVVNKDIAEFSVYQSADLVQSASNALSSLNDFSYDSDTASKIEELNNDATTVKVMAYVLFAFAGFAFFFSFAKRKFAAILGIFGLIDLLIMTLGLCGMTKDPSVIGISPSVGFYLSALLFVAGIVMNFIPAGDVDGGIKKGMNIGAVVYLGVLLLTLLVPVIFAAPTIKIGSQTWMKKDVCNGSQCTYSWDVAQKACPKGFHLPSLDEWKKLFAYANSSRENKETVLRMLDEKVIDDFYKQYKIDIGQSSFDDRFSWRECYEYREGSPGTDFWTSSATGNYAVVIASMETSNFLYCDKKKNLGKTKVRCIKD